MEETSLIDLHEDWANPKKLNSTTWHCYFFNFYICSGIHVLISDQQHQYLSENWLCEDNIVILIRSHLEGKKRGRQKSGISALHLIPVWGLSPWSEMWVPVLFQNSTKNVEFGLLLIRYIRTFFCKMFNFRKIKVDSKNN